MNKEIKKSISTLESVSDVILKVSLSNQAEYDSLKDLDSEKAIRLDEELECLSDAYQSLNESIGFLKQIK